MDRADNFDDRVGSNQAAIERAILLGISDAGCQAVDPKRRPCGTCAPCCASEVLQKRAEEADHGDLV